MELDEAIARRRMCRDFSERAVDTEVVDRLIDRARRAPSAGHTQGWSWLVLDTSETRAQFWSVEADPAWLERPSLPGVLRAPVVLVPFTSPAAYERRYAEDDKSVVRRPGGSRLPNRSGPDDAATDRSTNDGPATDVSPAGRLPGTGSWPVPWWDIDAAFAVMILLLGVVDEGLGALFFALHGEALALKAAFGVPADHHPLGAVALGWRADDERPAGSTRRGLRPRGEVVHRGHW